MVPTILIPAYNPDELLLQALDSLQDAGYSRFVVVDDGSRAECEPIFAQVARRSDTLLLRHSVNCGKGRAMKTGFNEILLRGMAEYGVIVCDADGQHPIPAVNDVAQEMLRHPDSLVLGVRKFFEADNVPLPNLLGNTITRGAFWLFTGVRFGDTQCGLRGFPESVIRKLMNVEGERFEYENTMLLAVRSLGIPVCQVPMEAVYIGENTSSHFNRVRDSIRIYKVILGFARLPIMAALLNFLVFFYLRNVLPASWGAAMGAGFLLGWIFMMLFLPRKVLPLASVCGVGMTAAICAVQCILGAAGIPAMGAWWIAALPVGIAVYHLWMRLRYGAVPANVRLDISGKG